MEAVWNKINFDDWELDGVLKMSVNELCEAPIYIHFFSPDPWELPDLTHTMSPAEARELAAKLVEVAAAADHAGVRRRAP